MSAPARIRTWDTRFRNPAVYFGLRMPKNVNGIGVFAFSRFGAFRCSVLFEREIGVRPNNDMELVPEDSPSAGCVA